MGLCYSKETERKETFYIYDDGHERKIQAYMENSRNLDTQYMASIEQIYLIQKTSYLWLLLI